jgi:hypothetical protein
VVVHSDQIYGRKPVIKLVRELMTREEVDGSLRNQRFPILVVEGFRGAGKTALLSALEKLLDQRVPYAKLDFQANRHATVPQALSALAFQLMRKCPRYGMLQFLRFIVGQLVMGLELDLTDHAQACRQVVAALERQRGVDTIRDVLLKTAGEVLKTAGGPVEPSGRYMFERILTWLTARAPGHIVLGSFQNWYGHRDLGLTNDSVDVLVDLNRWAGDTEDEDAQQRVDDLLWAAFLADLRAEFNRGRRADERSLNCVVLLDNADTMLGRRFLDELVRARRQRVAGGQDDADPLTLIATTRGALLADVPSADRALVTPDNARPGQLPRTPDRSRTWWLQYQLPDLTEDEVGRAVAALDLDQGNNQRLTRVVFQLTGGHPASTSLVLDAIAKRPPENRINPEAILGQAPSSDGSQRSQTLEDQVLDRLLVGVSDAALSDLVTCAAARERRHALSLAGQDDLLMGGQANYVEVLDPILWRSDDAAGNGAAGPALLRRLLRRRLALRDPAVSSSWAGVYARLRDFCRAEGGEADELYYALANGELGFVIRRLHQRLAELEIISWFELVELVTAAPHQHRSQEALIDEVRTLVRSVDLEQPLTSLGRLVAALWIAADPFSDSDRRNLHLQIAADCTDVARLSPGGPSAVLLQAARRHQRQAEWWD